MHNNDNSSEMIVDDREQSKEAEMVDSQFEIRVATESDATTIAQFNILMAKETENRDLDATVVHRGVQQVFQNAPHYGFYLVTQEKSSGRVVGSLMITYEWSDWNCKQYWYIQSLYVCPEFRRRGIFKRMYHHLKQMAQKPEHNCASIRLYVDRDNQKAQTTYELLGMTSHYLLYEQDL